MSLIKSLLSLALATTMTTAFSALPPQKIDTLTKMDVYLVPGSIIRKGDDVSYFLIFDFKETDKIGSKSFKSASTQYQGKCSGGTTTENVNVYYVGKMAEGKMVVRDESDPSHALGLPQSYSEKYTNIVCNIK
jgi:hypothetical protein